MEAPRRSSRAGLDSSQRDKSPENTVSIRESTAETIDRGGKAAAATELPEHLNAGAGKRTRKAAPAHILGRYRSKVLTDAAT